MSHECKCPGEDHPTFGACIRSKGIRVAYCQSAAGRDASAQKVWDSGLAEYREARRQGIQPDSTKVADTRRALDLSDQTGVAYAA